MTVRQSGATADDAHERKHMQHRSTCAVTSMHAYTYGHAHKHAYAPTHPGLAAQLNAAQYWCTNATYHTSLPKSNMAMLDSICRRSNCIQSQRHSGSLDWRSKTCIQHKNLEKMLDMRHAVRHVDACMLMRCRLGQVPHAGCVQVSYAAFASQWRTRAYASCLMGVGVASSIASN